MSKPLVKTIQNDLALRFGENFTIDEKLSGLDEIARIAGHHVTRHFLERKIDASLLRLLCACALSAPTKSDLQQADIIIVNDTEKRRIIADLVPNQPFSRSAPTFLIFLANGRRLPEISKLRGKPFPNDHLDQFFNAAVDSALTLANFTRAAEA
jgi:nitroreductase/FMN reductase [NAD(P)H]